MLDTVLATAITLLCVADLALLAGMARREARARLAAEVATDEARPAASIRSG